MITFLFVYLLTLGSDFENLISPDRHVDHNIIFAALDAQTNQFTSIKTSSQGMFVHHWHLDSSLTISSANSTWTLDSLMGFGILGIEVLELGSGANLALWNWLGLGLP